VRKKAKKVRRKEYRLMGDFSCAFDLNVLARSPEESVKVARDVIGDLRLPKVAFVKIGKRTRRLVDCIDYFLDCNGTPEMDNVRVDLADDHEKALT